MLHTHKLLTLIQLKILVTKLFEKTLIMGGMKILGLCQRRKCGPNVIRTIAINYSQVICITVQISEG